MPSLRHAHVQSTYRPLTAVFSLLVLAVIGGLIYAGWTRTVITVTPRLISLSTTFTVTVGPPDSQLAGTVTSEEKTATITVEPTGEGELTPAKASGTVTFHNTTNRDQPLTIGTRLQADNGVIVRTTTRVDVPANGTVEANVIADPEGEAGQLPPGHFIIVALWPGLQDKIFADSQTAFTGGLVRAGQTLSLDELTAASNQAQDKIMADLGSSQNGIFRAVEPLSVVSQPKPEVPSARYEVTVTAKTTTVTYHYDDLMKLATEQLTKQLADDQQLGDIEPPNLMIEDRPSTETVVLSVKVTAHSSLSPTSQLLQAVNYLNLSAAEVKSKAMGTTGIKDVSTAISPWWRTTTPAQARRITILLKPAS